MTPFLGIIYDVKMDIHLLLKGFNVRDHADDPSFLTQGFQGVHNHIERIPIQSSKTFIEKEKTLSGAGPVLNTFG